VDCRLEAQELANSSSKACLKGHSGHVDNERVDDLANRGIDELLEKGTD